MQYRLSLFNSGSFEPLPSTMNSEVAGIIHSVNLDLSSKSYRRNLSTQFRVLFEQQGWQTDTNLYFEEAKGDTPHYIKNRILAQVSWRHYQKIGTELLKFQTDYTKGHIDAGVFICVTDELLQLFRERPEALDGRKSFGGSITMERAIRYLADVSSVITVPLAMMGLLPK